MRIAIPIHSFEPGGVERVALRLARQWQVDGEQVTVVLGRNEGTARAQAPNLDYWSLREPFPTRAWETIWMIWSLYSFLQSQRVDVIFCPGNTYTVVCVAMRLLLGERCPPVMVKVSNDLDRTDIPAPLRPFVRFWGRVQGLFLDHFVALAEPMLPQVVKELAIPRVKASVIADPALHEAERLALAARRTPRSDGPCCFLTVGRLVAQKNQTLMIEAFALHARPGDTLVIAGDGPARGALDQTIRSRGLQGRVILAGHCQDIPALLTGADVFVLSSDYEGVPAALIEALAAGLPIATTDCCASMAWLLQYGRFGAMAPVGNAPALANAMEAARTLSAPAARMAEFVAQFTIERAAGTYLTAMMDLVQTRNDAHYEEWTRQARVWLDHGF